MEKDWFYTYLNGKFVKKDRKVPIKLNHNEVLVKPMSVGICGSDLYAIKHNEGESPIGHEWVGKIVEVGDSIKNYSVGEIVTSSANYCCQKCRACLSEDWSECTGRKLLGTDSISVISSHVKVHKSDLVKLPQELSIEAQVLLEVAFIGDLSYMHAKKIGLTECDKIAIFGAGPIGIFSYLALKHRGYEPILVEKSQVRVDNAKKLGLNVENFASFLIGGTNFSKYDTVIDCTGDGAGGTGLLPHAHLFPKRSGSIVIIGKYFDAKLDNNSFYKQNLRVSWLGHHGVEEFRQSVKFWTPIIEKYAKSLVRVFPFSEVEKAFEVGLKREHTKCILLDK
ncbi:medium chain dehydrogenase/reductase family protein [Halobacteriovorax sp. JY17]|uniref:zinc-dependent alcohol dehydrogenase n=1 Tax=Halobacteriovorax sp. JY17 TaxID=2014617 RepID=UPI000C5708B2|nr:medium chain dehydrogenase/reductase family protein [Halobacteriovorax sp. JY17]PIK14035.1 MAG: hypothetical protein CES88_13710 [Halobacteriovorax sp. JY17]